MKEAGDLLSHVWEEQHPSGNSGERGVGEAQRGEATYPERPTKARGPEWGQSLLPLHKWQQSPNEHLLWPDALLRLCQFAQPSFKEDIISPFTGGRTEAQRSEVIHPRSHRQEDTWLGFKYDFKTMSFYYNFIFVATKKCLNLLSWNLFFFNSAFWVSKTNWGSNRKE